MTQMHMETDNCTSMSVCSVLDMDSGTRSAARVRQTWRRDLVLLCLSSAEWRTRSCGVRTRSPAHPRPGTSSLVCCCLTHTHPFNGPFSGTTRVSRYQKGRTSPDFTEARDSEWQWHQLGHMQVCISLQTDNHASTPPLVFLQAGCPFAAEPTVSKHWSTGMSLS